MNNNRRKEIEAQIEALDNVKEQIESISEQEQESFDNLPENMQYGE